MSNFPKPLSQLGKAAAVEQAALGGKQADGDGAPRTVHAVHRDSADGVIDLGNVVEELNREDAEHTGDDADDGRAERVNDVAARGDVSLSRTNIFALTPLLLRASIRRLAAYRHPIFRTWRGNGCVPPR